MKNVPNLLFVVVFLTFLAPVAYSKHNPLSAPISTDLKLWNMMIKHGAKPSKSGLLSLSLLTCEKNAKSCFANMSGSGFISFQKNPDAELLSSVLKKLKVPIQFGHYESVEINCREVSKNIRCGLTIDREVESRLSHVPNLKDSFILQNF